MELVLSTIVLTAAVSSGQLVLLLAVNRFQALAEAKIPTGFATIASAIKNIVNIHKYSADLVPGIFDFKTRCVFYFPHSIRAS